MSTGATVIGKVAIKVIPDTGDFRSDAQRAMNRIEKELDSIKVKVDLAGPSERKLQAQLTTLTRRRDVTIAPKIDKAAAAKVGATLSALSGGRSIANLGEDLASWAGQLDKQIPKMATMALTVSNLASAALTGSANLFSLAGSLASTVGAGLALPGIFGGLAIGVGASIAVLKDFNKRLPEVKGKLAALQNQMSDRFWNVAEKPIRNFIDSLLPEFSAGITDTSGALGHFFANLSSSATGKFGGELQSMFDDLNKSIRIAGTFTDQFVGIIQKLGSVGAGNLPRLARWFGDISTKFDDFLADKGKSGLQKIVDQGVDALKHLGGVISGTGSLLAGLSQAAEDSGASTLATLDKTVNAAAKKVNEPKFQNALRDAFAGAREGLDELTSRSGKQFTSLMLRISDLFTKVLPKAGRTAGTALGAIFDALDQPAVENALLGFFDSLNQVVNDLAPTLPSVADGLAAVVDILGGISTNVSRGLAPALQSLGDSLPGLSHDLKPLIKSLGDLVQNAGELTASVLPDLASQLGDIAGSLSLIINPINDFVDLLQKLPDPIKSIASNLTALGLVVLAGTWLGGAVRAKMLGFSESLLQVSANAKVAQGSLFRASIAAENIGTKMSRGRLAIAGGALALGAVATQASGSNAALSILSSTATGAVIGSAFGPGWGTAIGAAGGALFGLYQQVTKTSDGLKDAKQPALDYAGTLDSITGAATAATRAMTQQALAGSDAASFLASFGLSQRQVVSAVLGNKNALEGVNAALNAGQQFIVSYSDQWGAQFTASAKNKTQLDKLTTSLQAQGFALDDVRSEQLNAAGSKAILGFIGDQTDAWKNSTKKVREQILASQDLSAVYKVFPKGVATKIDAEGIAPTRDALAKLAIQYDAMDKRHVAALISASGTDFTVKQIQGVINKLAELKDKTIHVVTVFTNKRGGTTSSDGGHSAEDSGRKAAGGYSKAFAKELDKLVTKIGSLYDKAIEKAGKHASAVKDQFAATIKNVKDLAKEHAKLEKQLTAAQAVLKGYQDQQTAYAETVKQTIISSGDITSFGVHTYEGLIRSLTKAADKAVAFQKVIADLTASGLNDTTLQQILAAGPEAGLAIAQAILSGGVAQINALQLQINTAAGIVGDAAGQHFFGDLVANAQSDVDKLIKQLGPLQERLRKFAHDLIKSLSEALKKEWNKQMGDGSNTDTGSGSGGGSGDTTTKPNKPPLHHHGGTNVAKQINLTYNAAPNKSISSEEELWEALGRAG